jgi:hypothetical protein
MESPSRKDGVPKGAMRRRARDRSIGRRSGIGSELTLVACIFITKQDDEEED